MLNGQNPNRYPMSNHSEDLTMHNTNRSHIQLLETIKLQRQQITSNMLNINEQKSIMAANSMHSELFTALGSSNNEAMFNKINFLRKKIISNEQELHKHHQIQTEAKNLMRSNHAKQTTIDAMTKTYANDGEVLRNTIEKIDSLKQQLDLLYRRRAYAANAAIFQQRKSYQSAVNHDLTQRAKSQDHSSMYHHTHANDLLKNTMLTGRPKASVEPFQIKSSEPLSNNGHKLVMSNNGHLMNSRKSKADLISLRNDSLKAAKRRSWAQSSDTAEHANILKILLEEQKKGKTHLTFSEIFPIKSVNKVAVEEQAIISPTKELSKPKPTLDINHTRQEPPSPEKTKTIRLDIQPRIENTPKEPVLYAESSVVTDPVLEIQPTVDAEEKVHVQHEEIEEPALDHVPIDDFIVKDEDEAILNSNIVEDSVTEEDSSCTEEIPSFESIKEDTETSVKSILTKSKRKKENRRIVFDPFILFLDGALEGQLDTVKENASKIDDISKANDEGITALHNAICACHYEIVKFLIENHANVNAQDSDGWTPLHCAASCNNLVMVKMLVENGACIYSMTMSDEETPSKKCEENEDGYASCASYLEMADKWAGIINDGIMYAIYSYETKQDDELDFTDGDALRVIERSTDEEQWWRCENLRTQKTGMVPINYLSLYPVWNHVEKNMFLKFEIPGNPPEVKSENEEIEEAKS